jgi:hypothetical protein
MGLSPQAVPFLSAAGREGTALPRTVLRADAAFLVGGSLAAFALGALGVPVAGMGVGEAHELALITGLLLWHAAPRRPWHLAAAAVHALLAAANLAHGSALVSDGGPATAVVTTMAHVGFAVVNAAVAARLETAPGD